MCLSTLHRGHFVRLINEKKKFINDSYIYESEYNIGDEIHYKHKENSKETIYEVLDVYVGRSKYNNNKTVKYKLRCKKCNIEIEKEKSFIFGCPCCDNKQVFPGFNDIATTDPWMIPFFLGGKEEASHYMANSSKKIRPICLNCGMQSDKLCKISNLKHNKSFKCKYCADGIKFPERFFIAFLQQIGCEYVYQAYEKDVGFKCGKKIYDFYIPQLSCIVETNGSQHYNKHGFVNNYDDIIQSDNEKRNYAINGGIKYYIELNCSDTSLYSLRNEIMLSPLRELFDLDKVNINWNYCIEHASNSLTKSICLDYENNYMNIKDLKEKYNMSNKGIRNALKRGNEIGWCIYTPHSINYYPIDVYYLDDYLFSGKCASDVVSILSNCYNVYTNKNSVNKYIKYKIDMNGYRFYRVKEPKRIREVIRNDS